MNEPARVPLIWLFVVAILLLLRGMASFASPTWAWGLDSIADLKSPWLVMLVPFALPLLVRPTLAVGRAVARVAAASAPVFLAFTGAMGALFVVFRSRNFLLGDSLLYVHALSQGIQIESAARREAGATLAVSALHWSLRKTALVDSQTTFVVASVAAGIVYLVLAFSVARLLVESAQGKGLIFVSLVALGGLQIFFGHAEYYSLVAASGMLYIFLALRWTVGKGTLVFPALALALALFIHVMSAIFFFSFAWLLVCAVRARARVQAAVSAALVPAILVSAAAVIRYPAESFMAIFSRGKHMLPLLDYDPDFYAYGLFDPDHLSEIANELLLTSPCLPLLAVAALWGLRRRGRSRSLPETENPNGPPETSAEPGGRPSLGGEEDSRGGRTPLSPEACPRATDGFLLFAALGAAVFSLTANPALGMARDWDIFAFPFMVISLFAAAVAVRNTSKRHILWLCGAVAVIGGLHLGLFVTNNRTPSAYVPRFRRIALQEDLFAPTPRAELSRYLGWEALKAGDREQAKKDLLRSIRDHATQVKAYKMLAVIMIGEQFDWLGSPEGSARRRTLEIESQEEMVAEAARLGLNQYYNSYVEKAPNKVRALIGAGIAAINVSAPDSIVVDAFKRAVEADPEDLEARAFWGDMLRIHGRLDEAEEQYEWVLSRRRWQVRAFIGRACVLGVRGEPEMAFILVKELREHYPWSIEAQQFLLDWRKGELKEPEDFQFFLITQ